MKKLAMMLEDLWVAITFAESGISGTVLTTGPKSRYQQDAVAYTA